MDKNLKGKFIIINVSEIIHVVMKKLWLIIAVGIILGAVGAAYAGMEAKAGVPMYRATTKLYMSGGSASVTASSINLGQAVIPNYMEIVESRPVLETVIANLGLNMTPAELKNCISDATPSGTNMLWISVVFPDAEWAKRVADELVVASASYALEIMGCVPPVVYEEASVPTRAYNSASSSAMLYGAAGFVAGAAMVGGLILVLYFFNNRFDTPAKVEDRLRTKLLAFIAKSKHGEQCPTVGQACKYFVNSLYMSEVTAKVFAFAGVTDEEGRDEVVSSFAEGLTDLGKKVLLLDLVSKEDVAEEEQDLGLSDFVLGECGFEEIVQRSEGSADRILRGKQFGIAGEIYGNYRFDELLSQCQNQYDYVFVNVPSLEKHQEAVMIAKKAKSVVMVLSAQKSSAFKAKKQVNILEEQSIAVVGAVLKDVKVEKNSYFKKTYKMFLNN